jgi:hypothetical protein
LPEEIAVDLSQILQIYEPKLVTAEVAFRDGIVFNLAFLSREALRNAFQDSKRTLWVRHQRTDETDPEVFRAKLGENVLGWQGVTPLALSRMGLLDIRTMPSADRERQMPFSRENLLALMKANNEVELFLLDAMQNPNLFPLQEEEKNLPGGSDGGPAPAE